MVDLGGRGAGDPAAVLRDRIVDLDRDFVRWFRRIRDFSNSKTRESESAGDVLLEVRGEAECECSGVQGVRERELVVQELSRR
jgi:hypothetical protein